MKKAEYKCFKAVRECDALVTKSESAITLIALVVTIIVLITLAGVSINLILGENGIISKARLAKENYEEASQNEKEYLTELEKLFSQIKIGTDSEVTLSTEQLDDYINRRVDAKINEIVDAKVNEKLATVDATPIGTIIAFSVNSVPEGYLACNGQSISQTEYAELYALLGTTYGVGNNSGEFKVPDLRGEFLRGTGTATRATGTGAAVGTHQNPTRMPYYCSYYNTDNKKNSFMIELNGKTSNYPADTDTTYTNTGTRTYLSYYYDYGTSTTGGKTWAYTARPTNTSVLYCIKAK